MLLRVVPAERGRNVNRWVDAMDNLSEPESLQISF
jgi:hypothetical protein